jgi:hypothetical protein
MGPVSSLAGSSVTKGLMRRQERKRGTKGTGHAASEGIEPRNNDGWERLMVSLNQQATHERCGTGECRRAPRGPRPFRALHYDLAATRETLARGSRGPEFMIKSRKREHELDARESEASIVAVTFGNSNRVKGRRQGTAEQRTMDRTQCRVAP